MSQRVNVRSFLHDLILVRGDGRSMRRAVIYLVLIAIAVSPAFWKSFASTPDMPHDGHAIASLSLAANRAFCGAPSKLSSGKHIGYEISREPKRLHQPIVDVITDFYGTVDRYCATVTVPFVNNENSLMLAESWILALAPRISLSGIGRVLLAARIAMVLVFALALLRGGASLLVTAVVLQVAFGMIEGMQDPLAYSLYSHLFALVALAIGMYLLAFETSNDPRMRVVVAVGGGFLSVFAVNMRTSYLPIFGLLFAIYMWASDHAAPTRHLGRRLKVAAAMCAGFALAYGSFQYALISRSQPARRQGQGPSYHVVAHPLVLSLALPPSALSQREGIEWDDLVGLVLAHRIDPQARYLTPEYESALWKYYTDLWSRYPAEMRQIYIEKFRIAGRHMIDVAKFDSVVITVMLEALHAVPDGIWLVGLFVAGAAASAWSVARRRRAVDLAICMVASSGILLMIECAVIMPFYYISYGNTLVFVCAVLLACVAQLAIAGVVDAADWLLARRAALPSISLPSISLGPLRGLPLKRVVLAVGIIAVVGAAIRVRPGPRPLHVYGDQLPEHTSQTVDLVGPPMVWKQRAAIVRHVKDGKILIDGRSAERFSYLLVGDPRTFTADTYIVGTGMLVRGGLTLGIQQAGEWVSQFNSSIPGPFRISIRIPAEGPYQVVLANAINDADLSNTVQITSLTAVR